MLLSVQEIIKIPAFLCVLALAVVEQLSAEKILSSIEETVLLHIQFLQAAVPPAPVWVLILEMLSSKAALINHPGC